MLNKRPISLLIAALATVGVAACAQAVAAPTFEAPQPELSAVTALPPLVAARPAESTAAEARASEAELALGKYLTFDNALSGDQKLNCATCHIPEQAWTDGLPLSAGYPGSLYFRNTPTLLNSGQKEVLYWDGRIADLPTVIRDHVAEAHFMNADGRLVVERLRQKPQYVELFDRVYGGPPTYGRLLNAVAAYVGSLGSSPSSYDKFLAGDSSALSAQAQEGLALFEGRAGCSTCHSGPNLTDAQYHRLAVPDNPDIFAESLRHITFRRFFRTLGVPDYASLREDVGRYALTQDGADRGMFLTPSLREVSLTAPYMHNGAFETLEDVVTFYNQGGGQGSELASLALTPEQQAALVALLESLSGDLPAVEPPDPPAYQLTTLGADG